MPSWRVQVWSLLFLDGKASQRILMEKSSSACTYTDSTDDSMIAQKLSGSSGIYIMPFEIVLASAGKLLAAP